MSAGPDRPDEPTATTAGGDRRRPIRSFVLRRSHFSPAQRDAYDRLMARFGVPPGDVQLDFDRLFGRVAPTVLEIGFGMGESLAESAAAAPETNFLGVEVHTPGVGALLKRIEAGGLENVRIVEHDALAVVARMIGDATLDGVHVFFPDPWPKLRHHKRRLIQAPFVAELSRKLKPGGYLHVATDWPDYAEHIIAVFDSSGTLRRTDPQDRSPATGAAPARSRPTTKFERRGLSLGHPIADIVGLRLPASESDAARPAS